MKNKNGLVRVINNGRLSHNRVLNDWFLSKIESRFEGLSGTTTT